MPGTVIFNNIDSVNRLAVKGASTIIKDKPRGAWYVCQGYDVTHAERLSRDSVAERSGFILFQDRATVILYTNELKDTPNQRIGSSDNPHAAYLVHTLTDLHR